jgi:putative ABC transport system permease protein
MFKNYFLITIRSMMKNKFFIIVNILGMGIAIACCIVGYFAYEYDSTFDHNHEHASTLYRVSSVREFDRQFTKFGLVPKPLSEAVRQNMKDVDQATRLFYSHSNFKREDDLFDAKLGYVDAEFFSMFTFDFIVGNGAGLKDKTSVVICEPMAIRLFKTPEEALGKTITQVYGSELKELKITGVFKEQPQNSSVFFREAYMNAENHKDEFKNATNENWNEQATLFVQITNPARVPAVLAQLQRYKENNNKVREDFVISEFTLDPLEGMAHADRDAEVRSWTWDAPPASAIVGSGIMGILILLIACFNLTNTAIAISSRRLKEIGIRKVMGGIRQQLIIQFIGETTFICFMAFVVGIAIAGFLIDGWNIMWDYMRLTEHYLDNPRFFIFAVATLIFTALLAGGYPAFYISKFEPISILKGKLKFGGTNNFTRLLLFGQFMISMIAIVSAIAFYQNARYQEAYDMGFDGKSSIIAWFDKPSEVLAFRNALQSNPEIISMSGAASGIFSNRKHEPVKHKSHQVEVDIIDVGDNYLETMNLTLTDGRSFKKDSESDKLESVIISKRMADMFEWKDPLGKEVIWKDSAHYFVVGVVKDVYTQGLWRELDPLMIRYVGEDKYSQLVVTAKAGDVANINTFMESKWKEIFPNRLYNGHMLSNNLQEMIDVNENILLMFGLLGMIALCLSVTGLFTLVSLNIIKRMKEIGVRKVLGASIGNITRIINTEFAIILSISATVGCVVGYFAADSLMSSIWRYYQAATPVTFVLAIVFMIGIAAMGISYKVYKAADMNPVNTLRDE